MSSARETQVSPGNTPTAETDARAPMSPKGHAASFNMTAHAFRGVTSLMVFVAHLAGGTALNAYADDPSVFASLEHYWNFGTNVVFFFFIISGFVIIPSSVKYSTGGFAARRLIRIYPLFFAMTILFIVLNAVTDTAPELMDPWKIIFALTFATKFTATGQLTPNAWSIDYEMWFYLLTGLVMAFAVHRPSKVGLTLAVLCAVTFTIYFPATLFFLGGVMIRLISDRGMLPNGKLLPVAELLTFGGTVYFLQLGKVLYVPSDFVDPNVTLTIVFSVLYFMLAISPGSISGRIFSSRWIFYLGTISYSLFLTHPYVYLPMRIVFDKMGWFGPNFPISVSIFILVTIPLGILAAHLAHITVETWLYQKVFKQKVF